jgi:hypothetical protein
MSQYKFIGGDGETYGPYSRDEMQQFMAENRVNSQTQVSADDGAWQTAGQLPELASGEAPTVPATLGMPAAPSVPAAYGMTQPTVKPGKLQAIAIITLVQGIMAIIGSLVWALSTLCLYFPFIYGLVYGIMATIKGSAMLGKNPWPAYQTVRTTAIMGIVNVINCDLLFGVAGGIVILVFLNDPEVKAYIRSQGGQI